MDFILFNNGIIPASDFCSPESWLEPGFRVTRVMWFANGEIPLFDAHLDELARLFDDLEKPLPVNFPPRQELLRLSLRLVNKNKAFMGGWLHLMFVFKEAGMDYTGAIRKCPMRSLPFDPAGKMAAVSHFVKYSGHFPARYRPATDDLWRAEHVRISGTRTEISIFLNEIGIVTEALEANLFCIKRNNLLTPGLNTGCYSDLIRKKVLQAAETTGFRIIESDRISLEDLMETEEIFTASEKDGFRWIQGIDTRRFVKTKTELIWKQFTRTGWPRSG